MNLYMEQASSLVESRRDCTPFVLPEVVVAITEKFSTTKSLVK